MFMQSQDWQVRNQSNFLVLETSHEAAGQGPSLDPPRKNPKLLKSVSGQGFVLLQMFLIYSVKTNMQYKPAEKSQDEKTIEDLRDQLESEKQMRRKLERELEEIKKKLQSGSSPIQESKAVEKEGYLLKGWFLHVFQVFYCIDSMQIQERRDLQCLQIESHHPSTTSFFPKWQISRKS